MINEQFTRIWYSSRDTGAIDDAVAVAQRGFEPTNHVNPCVLSNHNTMMFGPKAEHYIVSNFVESFYDGKYNSVEHLAMIDTLSKLRIPVIVASRGLYAHGVTLRIFNRRDRIERKINSNLEVIRVTHFDLYCIERNDEPVPECEFNYETTIQDSLYHQRRDDDGIYEYIADDVYGCIRDAVDEMVVFKEVL